MWWWVVYSKIFRRNMELLTFVASLITAGITLAVCLINNAFQTRKAENEREKQMIEIQASFNQAIAVIECHITELSARVEKHNNVVERTYALEKDVAVLKNRESVSENRLKDLENDGK